MASIREHLKSAAEILQSSGVLQPSREAKSLLAFALEKDRTFLVAHSEYELSTNEEKRFRDFLTRRARREPFQYITGRQEFYGLDFLVNEDVLIPRPETELIVENAIAILRAVENARICEVGVGSGCISTAILHNIETARAIGLDISDEALQIARKNSETHKVSERLELKISDVFAALTDEKFDLIVSNPPYISSADIESLQDEVRDYEPLTALTDGRDGLSIVEKIVFGAPKFLKDGGFLLMEIGFGQSAKVAEMFSAKVWRGAAILPDWQGIPRIVRAQMNERVFLKN